MTESAPESFTIAAPDARAPDARAPDARAGTPAGDRPPLWTHEVVTSEALARIVIDGAPEFALRTLAADETRPCCSVGEAGIVLILRGVNFNDPEKPEDMVSLRLWVARDHVHSIALQRVRAVDELRSRLLSGDGPKDASGLLSALVANLSERLKNSVVALTAELDVLEERFLNREKYEFDDDLLAIRRRAIWFYRYAVPQAEALAELLSSAPEWLTKPARQSLRASRELTIRAVEHLAAIREHAAALQDQIRAETGKAAQRTTYLLTIVAAIFLPLNLIAGVFGANLAGMPGQDDPRAFWIFVTALALIAAGGFYVYYKYK